MRMALSADSVSGQLWMLLRLFVFRQALRVCAEAPVQCL